MKTVKGFYWMVYHWLRGFQLLHTYEIRWPGMSGGYCVERTRRDYEEHLASFEPEDVAGLLTTRKWRLRRTIDRLPEFQGW